MQNASEKKKLKPEKNQCTLGISDSKFELHAAPSSAHSTTDDKTAKPRTYCTKWEHEYPWLYRDEDGMKCQICTRNGRKNAFVSRTTNFKKSRIEGHVKSKDHQFSLLTPAQREQRREVQLRQLSEREKGATVALKAALYIL